MRKQPINLEALRTRFHQIVKGEDELRLSSKALAFLEKMLVDPAGTSVKTISELADELGTHRSSLTRLAQKLGFEGFPEFQAVFRREVTGKTNFYTNQVEKYLQKVAGTQSAEKSIIEQIASTEWSNLLLAMEKFDSQQFEATVASVLEARRVSVLGLRGSYPVAYFLGYYLKMIRDDVSIAGTGGHILAEDLGNLHPGDLLFAISAAPYTKRTVDACHIAHDLGIDIIALTDSEMSPLTNYAKYTLLSSCKGNYYFTPLISLMIYAEALLAAIIGKSGEVSLRNLKTKEMIFAKLDIEIGRK